MGRVSISALVPVLLLALALRARRRGAADVHRRAPRAGDHGRAARGPARRKLDRHSAGRGHLDGAASCRGASAGWRRFRVKATNPDCVTNPQAPYLEPIGEGTTVTATMPADVTPESLGQPDASGGVYLTLVANVTVGAESFAGVYRLRLGLPADGNQNPVQAGVLAVDVGGVRAPRRGDAAGRPRGRSAEAGSIDRARQRRDLFLADRRTVGRRRPRGAAHVVVLDRRRFQRAIGPPWTSPTRCSSWMSFCRRSARP